MKRFPLMILSALLILTNCSSPTVSRHLATQESLPLIKDKTIHIISTTDLHGYITAQKTKAGLGFGGVDYMSGYFKIAKHQDPDTLFLDSGDLFQGTIVSNEFEGSPVVKFYNYVDYAATAIGNHEFDYGPVGTDTVPLHPGEDPLGALKARERQARFPFLSANICSVNEDAGKCADNQHYAPAKFTRPYIIKSVNGVKIGIIGLTTTSTPTTTMAANIVPLRFMPANSALERYVPEIKAKGADFVIVLAHVGGFCDHGVCNPQDELFSMIDSLSAEVKKSIPIILAGHTHNYENIVYNGMHVMIEGCYGQSFGYESLTFHEADRSVTVDDTQSVDFCQSVFPDTKSCYKGTGSPVAPTFLGETVKPDPRALRKIRKDAQIAETESDEVVGKSLSPMLKAGPESSMGEFMTDSMRLCYSSPACDEHADVALQNDGGIRSEIATPGVITYGQIFLVEPFDNMIATVQLTGEQLRGAIDGLTHQGGIPSVSGITIDYNSQQSVKRNFTNDAGQTQAFDDDIISIKMADGTMLDESKVYDVAMADFLATGGGGTGFFTTVLKTQPVINNARKVRDTMVDYMKSVPDGVNYAGQAPRLIDHASK